MPWRAFADLVVVLHLAFIVFVIAGGLLALRWRRVAWLHLPAVAWAVFIQVFSVGCPLTPLENVLRRAAGASGYSESFIDHYLVPLVYPPGLTPGIQLVLAALLLAVNAAVYLAVWRR